MTSAPPDESLILSHFQRKCGGLEERAIMPIVPSSPPVQVRCARNAEHVCYFTVGMSSRPLKVPEQYREFTFCELFIQLSPDWKFPPDDDDSNWPVHWLQQVSLFPHAQGLWLGAPYVVLANESEKEHFSTNCRFTGMLLIVRDEVKLQEGVVKLYQMTPLYWEEILLEREQGIGALMNAFDANEISMVVNVDRANVAS
ncbi:MAG: suppressor of fused domain protein [Planctomycetota bacterium]